MIIKQINLPNTGYGNQVCTLTAYIQEQLNYQPDLLRPAVLICPGGGYRFISAREAQPIALAFLNEGYQAFVLDYTLLDENQSQELFPAPFHELAHAMAEVRNNAQAYYLDPQNITLVGFSAGGHLCSMFTGLTAQLDFLQRCAYTQEEIQPNAQILAYPVIDLTLGWPSMKDERERMTNNSLYYKSQDLVHAKTPPTFLWHTQMDATVPVENCYQYAMALVKHRIRHECHIYQDGLHGLSLANNQTTQGQVVNDILPHVASWFRLAIEWLAELK